MVGRSARRDAGDRDRRSLTGTWLLSDAALPPATWRPVARCGGDGPSSRNWSSRASSASWRSARRAGLRTSGPQSRPRRLSGTMFRAGGPQSFYAGGLPRLPRHRVRGASGLYEMLTHDPRFTRSSPLPRAEPSCSRRPARAACPHCAKRACDCRAGGDHAREVRNVTQERYDASAKS